MGPANLATIFGPSILAPQNQNPTTMLEEMAVANQCIATIIMNYKAIFTDEDAETPTDHSQAALSETVTPTPRSRPKPVFAPPEPPMKTPPTDKFQLDKPDTQPSIPKKPPTKPPIIKPAMIKKPATAAAIPKEQAALKEPAPKLEAPKPEAPKLELPKVEAPKLELPKVEPKAEPKIEEIILTSMRGTIIPTSAVYPQEYTAPDITPKTEPPPAPKNEPKNENLSRSEPAVTFSTPTSPREKPTPKKSSSGRPRPKAANHSKSAYNYNPLFELGDEESTANVYENKLYNVDIKEI